MINLNSAKLRIFRYLYAYSIDCSFNRESIYLCGSHKCFFQFLFGRASSSLTTFGTNRTPTNIPCCARCPPVNFTTFWCQSYRCTWISNTSDNSITATGPWRSS